MDEITGVWPVDVRMSGYVRHGATFYHGITIELLLTSMYHFLSLEIIMNNYFPMSCGDMVRYNV